MKKYHFSAATAARKEVHLVLVARVKPYDPNPILTASLIARVGFGVYSIKKAVDKATRKEGGKA